MSLRCTSGEISTQFARYHVYKPLVYDDRHSEGRRTNAFGSQSPTKVHKTLFFCSVCSFGIKYTTLLKCMPPAVQVNWSGLWPLTLKPFQQCLLIWWIFVASFIEIPALYTEIPCHVVVVIVVAVAVAAAAFAHFFISSTSVWLYISIHCII